MTANLITCSRIVFSGLLLAVPPSSLVFAALYLLCGVSDVLDGFAARKLHTESRRGAMLDSVADLFFAVIYVLKILPLLSIPLWILVWTTVIAGLKFAVILIASRKTHSFRIDHSFGNRLTGLLIFLLPLSVRIIDVRYGASVTCIAATVTVIKEIAICKGGKNAV